MYKGHNIIKDSIARKNEQGPQYDYMWRVELPSLESSLGFFDQIVTGTQGIYNNLDPSGTTTGFTNRLQGAIEGVGNIARGLSALSNMSTNPMADLNHRVATFNTPYFQMDTKKITDRNSYWYSASNNDIGTISMTMDEFEDGATYKYLDSWKNMIVNPNGTYNPPALYKHDIKFIRMSSTNLDLHIHTYRGYFISELANIDNSYEGNGVLQYTATLTGDSVETRMIPESQVRTAVASAEASIMLQDWANDKFRVDGLSGAQKLRMLGDIADLFS